MIESQNILGLPPGAILDSLANGVYVTDVSRRIVFWSKTAAAITGWSSEEIVGKCCHDDVLCHVDKDGHKLCGEEYCPLHRAMVTRQGSDVPIIVFAKGREGQRVPVHVSVAPIVGAGGEVIGGVELFRDLSGEFSDYERARKIQAAALGQALPHEARIRCTARYMPRDIIGGDCYRFARFDDDRYGFFLADVSGHGVAGALYTMFLLSLWDDGQHLLARPGEFAQWMNTKLCQFVTGGSFATAICGLADLKDSSITLACAGGPSPLLVRKGEFDIIGGPGLPWGLVDGATYDTVRTPTRPGDSVLLFTDGATEINTSADQQLDSAGLVEVLRELRYPAEELDFNALEQAMLIRSNRIRFDDDVTFLELRLS